MNLSTARLLTCAATLAAACALPAHAAFISIDDSDPSTITITAGDFEGGFSVNGTLLTTGLGNSGSITLADGGYSIQGSWFDLGRADQTRVDLLFALASDPTFSTSGIEFGASSVNGTATLTGSFGGFIDPSLYFSTTRTTHLQDGRTVADGTAFLSVSFRSEAAAVPLPGTLALAGLGLLALARRRR